METVLCFDSGIGGLAYLHHLRQLPMRWIYLADNAYFPFGEQPQSQLRERICQVIALALSRYPCRLVLLLCNTATVLALDELRYRFPQKQFIGTVPAIKPAAAASKSRKIAMLASRSTSQADYVAKLHKQFATDCKLEAINAASLIEFIEQHWRPGPAALTKDATKAAAQAIAPFIQPILDSGADQVVLGCTHFLHVKEQLRSQLQASGLDSDSNIKLVDSVAGVYHRLQSLLENKTESSQHKPHLLLLTKDDGYHWRYWGMSFKMHLQLLPYSAIGIS